jgi:hypothetical protein
MARLLSISSCIFLVTWNSSFEKALFNSFAHSSLFWGEFSFFELPVYFGFQTLV